MNTSKWTLKQPFLLLVNIMYTKYFTKEYYTTIVAYFSTVLHGIGTSGVLF